MKRALVERATGRHIPEEEGLALAALPERVKHRKLRFAALVVVVEIDQDCEYALADLSQFFFVIRRVNIDNDVEMGLEFVSHQIVQDVWNFQRVNLHFGDFGDSVTQDRKDEIAVRSAEMAAPAGAHA